MTTLRRLTAEEVGIVLNVTPRRVRMIPAGELPYIQLEPRGRRQYEQADVRAYLEARRIGRVTPA